MVSAAMRQPFTVSVNLSFTFYACGLFANNLLSRTKTPLCYYNVCVYYTNPPGLPQDFLPEEFRWYRTKWPLLQFVWHVFAVVCFPHMVRSSRRIVEDDRGVAAEEP